MEGIENNRRMNDHLQEVTLESEDVVSYGFENPGTLLEDLTPWITTLHLEKSISCIHKIQYTAMVLFEITAMSATDKRHISLTQPNSRNSPNSDPWGKIKKNRKQKNERYQRNAIHQYMEIRSAL